MNRTLIDEYHSEPALLRRRITAEAHRLRALALGNAIAALFASIGRLVNHVKARLSPRPQRWIERLG